MDSGRRSASPVLEKASIHGTEHFPQESEGAFPSLSTKSTSFPISSSRLPMPSSTLSSALITEIVDIPGVEAFKKSGRSIADIAQSAQTKSGAVLVEVSTSKRNDLMTFLVKGTPKAVEKAKNVIFSLLSAKVMLTTSFIRTDVIRYP